ncbi:MAG: substrate-binding domain-containing protein [Selenomonadales bacterium]|jgi:branched-chain amino acid transport system substrate-binding protein|nr:substrate-binding domain-containing protein [Selenomonadales bacterium]
MKRKLFGVTLVLVLLVTLVFTGCRPAARPEQPPIKIGALASLSGVLQDYGTQFRRGFELGLEFMTEGKMEVAGRKIEVIWEDTTTVPAVARERAIKLLDQDKVDLLVGVTSSADAIAVLPVAQEFKRVIIVEPAAADVITGQFWNRYVFRTGRNTAQDAIAMADIVAKPGVKIATLAPDTAFGRAGVTPFVPQALARGATVVAQEFAPAATTDFTPHILRLIAADPDYLFVIWAGANNPWRQLMELDVRGKGINIVTGAPEIAALRLMNDMVGMTGFTVYYHTVPPTNAMNDWLIKTHQQRFGSPPDIFTSGGMANAAAVITALRKTEGNTDSEVLIQTLRGMQFDSPTGQRWFRSEDHQAMQPLFEITLTAVPGVDHPVPQLVRVISAERLAPPVTVPAGAPR